jgi:histone H3/H4
MPAEIAQWRRCSSCKTPIAFAATYWVCNVSTCNRPRTGLFFCTVSCWDAHLSVVNHRESWALERRAPTRAEWEREQAQQRTAPSPPRQADRLDRPASAREASARSEAKPSEVKRSATAQLPRDVLIVISKLKAYVRARSGFSTSDRVAEPLSDAVRELCDRAVEKARADGRKTVLERDFE